jgi:acyl CoA:acetate/3-ketoacid CoA transferase
MCFSFFACSPSRSPATRSEITGAQQERVTRASSILAKYCQLPGPLLDAHMAEDVHDNSGGMVPGPSEVWLSGVITIPVADLSKWRMALSPAITPAPSATFASPIAPPSWWPPASAFEGCEFYSPKTLTGRSGGFVALSPSASAIYFSTTKL